MSTTAAELVAQARQGIRETTPQDARSNSRAVLIDVREPAEYASGHIPGAINIPRGVLEFQVDAHPAVAGVSDPALSNKDCPIIIYCRTGGRAALATQALQSMGFSDVLSIAGGILAWSEAGLPLNAR
ncbi:MAG: sulfurtransferase [Xanthomonadales bacterium]|nr:sulfurtransferase [Xanthomonadales bacterium]